MTDKELLKKLKGLKSLEAAGNPDKDWVLSNKKILMSQVAPATSMESKDEKVADSVYYFRYIKDMFSQRVFKPAMATLSVLALFVVYTATVSVAGASLPGDMLYPVKTTQEKVQLALTFDKEERVKLKMSFVTRRAGELEQIVKISDNNEKKTKISQTVKQITSDVESVKEDLSQISIASVNKEALDVAKDIDTKALAVKDTIVSVKKQLPKEVKAEVSADINEAIAKTNDTGNVAINVILDKYEKGEDISDDEVISRVAERIKNTEKDIESAIEAINKVTTSTPQVLSTKNSSGSTSSTSEVLDEIKDKPQTAQSIIEEAKDLLDNNDFTSVLEKITESNNLVGDIEQGVDKIEGSTTSTGRVLGDSENTIGLPSNPELEVTDDENETTVNVITQ